LFLILFSLLPAQELREMQVEEVPTRVILDIGFADRSILIVESTIPKLMFASNRGVVKVEEKAPGEWWVELKPGVQLLDFMAEGYLAYRDYRIALQPREAKKIRITPKPIIGAYVGFDINRPTIRLRYTPASPDERVYGGLDGNVMRLDFSTGECVFRPEVGRHTIRLNSGGRIWERSYDLQAGQIVEDEVVFPRASTERWDIKAPGGLYITSEPPGATVFLNEVEQGTTPLTLDELQPGIYQIEFVKDLYLATSRTVEVKSLEYLELKVDLTPNFGRVKIESDPPGATVWINDRQRGTTPLEISRFNAGRYTLRITQSLYYEQTDTFEIRPGGEFIRTYRLKPQFGKVTLNSKPAGAEVTVDGVKWGKTPLTKDRVPSGEHMVHLALQNYFDEELVIRLGDGEHFQRTFTMRPRVGWLTVITDPPGASVTITEPKRPLGTTPLIDIPLDRGSYNLMMEREGYEPYETAIALTYGGRERIEAKLQRSVGHLRVSTDPQGARIFLNGQYRGDSPIVLKDVPTGNYEIRLEKSGYDIFVGRVSVNRNEIASCIQRLSTAGTREWLKRRTQAQLLAVLVPSGGQIYSRQYVRGALYAGAFIGSVVNVFLRKADYDDAKRYYWQAVDAYRASSSQRGFEENYLQVQSAHKRIKDREDRYLLSLAACVGVYALQLTDAWIWGGGKRPVSVQLGREPGFIEVAFILH
ncbi:MAG: PEGA domain-containing protein, partial [Nitrososphaerota archaeon]